MYLNVHLPKDMGCRDTDRRGGGDVVIIDTRTVEPKTDRHAHCGPDSAIQSK